MRESTKNFRCSFNLGLNCNTIPHSQFVYLYTSFKHHTFIASVRNNIKKYSLYFMIE